jgi:hypothetical protein
MEELQPTIEGKNFFSKHPALTVVGGIIILLILVGIVSSGSNNNTSSTNLPAAQITNSQQSPCATYSDANALAQNASSVSYKVLEKDPSSYMGTPAVFTGQVVQIMESNGQGVIRLAVTKDSFGNWDSSSIVYIQYTGHNDVVDDDVVTVYGLLAGPQTYASQANFQITVPSMYACFITKKDITTQL